MAKPSAHPSTQALRAILPVLLLAAVPPVAAQVRGRDVAGPSVGPAVPRESILVPYDPLAPRIDGELREWGASFRSLDRAAWVWANEKRRGWKSKDDFSAELWIRHDTTNLYLAGRIHDDHHVPVAEGADLETGDSIEVFFDVERKEDSGEAARKLGKEDVQLFLLPMSGNWFRRPWDRDDPLARPIPTGSELEGMELAAVRQDERSYTFEVRIPMHNFLPFEPGRTYERLGFHLACNDRDPGSEVVHYVTLNGQNPTLDTTGFLELVFDPPLFRTTDTGPGLNEQLRRILPWGLVGLLVFTTILFFSRRTPLIRFSPAQGRLARLFGVLLLLLGLALPGWLLSQQSAAEQRLQNAANVLAAKLPLISAGTLTSYVGEARDQPLLDLLTGKPIRRKQSLSYRFLAEMATDKPPRQFGKPPRKYPEEGFLVRPYWLPLPLGQPQGFAWKAPLRAGRLYFVTSPVDYGFIEVPPSTLRVTYRSRDGEDVERVYELPEARTTCAVFGKENRDMTYVFDTIPDGTVGLSITASGEIPLELVGITLVPDNPDDEESRPLVLGQALGEVETDLRGLLPRDAGFELTVPGETRRVEIPQGNVKRFQQMWLVYSATYPELLPNEPPKGEVVCRVGVRFAEGPELDVELRHQESMFYELSSRNSEDVSPEVPVVQAEVGGEDEDRRINVVYRVDLRQRAPVRGLTFETRGTYPVRFRSVIFGFERTISEPDPPDSPVQSAGPGQAQLDEATLGQLRGGRLAIYRNGSLVASNLAPSAKQRHAEIPAAVQDALRHEPKPTVGGFLDVGATRIFRRFLPLDKESGAVLGMFAVDAGFRERARVSSLLGMLLCLMSIPFLLLLFNDTLGLLANLRLRLMAVVSVAAVVPMAVLFILLVRTLEGDHEAELQRTARQAVRAATEQLEDREAKLLDLARVQVTYLLEIEKALCSEAGPDVDKLKLRLQSAMTSQRDWKGGFVKLEYTPRSDAPDWLVPFTTFDEGSDTRLDTPLRDQPTIYLGKLPVAFLGVRVQQGPMSLSIARPVDRELLGQLGARQPTVLCYTSGYPMTGTEEELTRIGHDATVRQARAAVRLEARNSRDPVFQRHRLGSASWIAAYDVLRDTQDTPRAILGVMQPDVEANLTLANERVPVRTFFVVICGLLLVLSLALASIVTSRITAPIERLEQGAEALRRGEFDIRLDTQEGGQIGRLTETFNNMAQDLRGRIQDLHQLNRGIQELTSGLDLDHVLGSAIAFFARHSPADRVRVILLDRDRDRVEVFGEDRVEIDRRAPDVAAILEASEPLSLTLDAADPAAALPRRFPDHRSLLALPLVMAGRSRGAVLLLFEVSQPPEVNLELLSTIAAQTTVAVENAQLYLHAVEDLYTGAYVPDYFSRLVGRAVAAAQDEDRPLALIAVHLVNGQRQEVVLGAVGFGRYMERVTTVLRGLLPATAAICRSAPDSLKALLPGVDRAALAGIVEAVEAGLLSADLDLRGVADLALAAVVFPDDGASAEFLFHALQTRLRGGGVPSAAATDVPEQDGVVLSSPLMAEVVRVLQKVAPTDLTILLDGETGTGKEVLVNLCHKWSKRAKGPLVKVHCAALSESLLQSELFGHEKGAFTGATEQRIGKFEQAEGGTIFLDEIGEVSLDTQVKLLRVLQEREVDRVGGTQPVPVDVRVIAATNRDIEDMVAAGTFREDLYYRLQGMVVTLPPLRERKSEIPGLLEVFRREAVEAGHTAVRGFTTDAMDEIFRREWPGNIRELRNAAFRAMVLAGEGMVQRSHLLGFLPPVPGGGEGQEDPSPPGDPPGHQGDDPAVGARSPDGGSAGDDELPPYRIPRPDPPPARPPELTPRLQRLLALVQERGSLANQDYVAVVGVSSRTGLRDLNELVKLGLIERIGRRRGARYRPVSGSGAGGGVGPGHPGRGSGT